MRKVLYKIVRYGNGWAVDVDTGDPIKDSSGVYEDEYLSDDDEDDDGARLSSLISLLANTFEELEDIEFIIPEYESDEAPEENADL